MQKNAMHNSEQPISIPDFSQCENSGKVFDVYYNFLANNFKIIELDVFFVDTDKGVSKLQHSNASVSLDETFNDLEERGMLEWAVNSNEIKLLPNTSDIEQIRTVILIPIIVLQEVRGYIIANTPLELSAINQTILPQTLLVSHLAFSIFYENKTSIDTQYITNEFQLLRSQTLQASNQIALSQIIAAINETMEIPLKIIKANVDLIEKGVGDAKRRTNIIIEQFHKLNDTHNLIQHFNDYNEVEASNHKVVDIILSMLEIVEPHISKSGIVLTHNLNDNADVAALQVNGFSRQLIFALLNVILYAINNMPDGGKITLGVYRSGNRLSIIIADNGFADDTLGISGDFISLMDTSVRKIKNRFLFFVSQQIILQHRGKFSMFAKQNSGNTYKITLPLA